MSGLDGLGAGLDLARNFYLSMHVGDGLVWWVRGDHIAGLMQLIDLGHGHPKTRVSTTYGSNCEVNETPEEILNEWAEAMRKVASTLDP